MTARRIHATILFALGVATLNVSCASEPPETPLTLQFLDSGKVAQQPNPVTACDFAGPHQTVALVTQTTALNEADTNTKCSMPYAQMSATPSFRIDRVAAGVDPGDEIEVVIEVGWWSGDSARRPLTSGSTHLVSIRESGGAWFVDWMVPVAIVPTGDPTADSGSGAADRFQVDLPADWGTLKSEMQRLSLPAIHPTACSSKGKTLPFYDDQEYYDHRFGDVPDGCSGDVEPVATSTYDASSEIGKTTSDAPDAGP